MEKEKKLLYEELGIEGGDLYSDSAQTNIEDTAKKIAEGHKIMMDEYEIDPSKFNVFSRDMFRIDIGLIIQRPPIFAHMRDIDIEFVKMRSQLMNEYYCNLKERIAEFDEVSIMNEDVLAGNTYASQQNLDNFPTHEMTDPVTGEVKQYCAASKNFAKVDPACPDKSSLHYAPEDRIYFIVQNKYTNEWEFPTGHIYFGQSFLRAK